MIESDPKTIDPTDLNGADADRQPAEVNAPGEAAADGEAAAAPGVGSAAGPYADIERLESEKADLTDRLLRLAADMDNLRRRTERDVVDARRYAVTRFAGDMLIVADNLKRALDAVSAEERASTDQGLKTLLDGVEMTGREMDRLLEKNGIAPIAAKGERFDPNRHQAVFEMPDASVPAGTVVQVMQEGFTIGDRVLRAAMVGVAKAPTAAQGGATEATAGDA